MMNRRWGVLIAALLFTGAMLGGCSSADSRSEVPRDTGELLSDAGITASVKLALAFEPGVKATEINVDTHRGTVTLHGDVGSEAERQLAVRVAEDISGVMEIVNEISVRS